MRPRAFHFGRLIGTFGRHDVFFLFGGVGSPTGFGEYVRIGAVTWDWARGALRLRRQHAAPSHQHEAAVTRRTLNRRGLPDLDHPPQITVNRGFFVAFRTAAKSPLLDAIARDTVKPNAAGHFRA
jgi:hypothetical protein